MDKMSKKTISGYDVAITIVLTVLTLLNIMLLKTIKICLIIL